MFAASYLNWDKFTFGVCLLFNLLCKKKKSNIGSANARKSFDYVQQSSDRGGSRIFLRRGCTTKEWHSRLVRKTNFKGKYEEESFNSGEGGVHPLDPPPTSAPE